jgi:hypothetical protein
MELLTYRYNVKHQNKERNIKFLLQFNIRKLIVITLIFDIMFHYS